ncbi:MAG: hypothetical protein ACHQNT_02690 [Bacteroidia bacterium]
MIELCCKCFNEINNSNTNLLPIVITLGLLVVAYFSWLSNTKPVLIFYMNNKGKYKIKNVGNGPAMNLLISYVFNETEPNKWINPVRCYSIKSGGMVDLDWLVTVEKRDQLLRRHGKYDSDEDKHKIFFVTDNNVVIKKTYSEVDQDFKSNKIFTVGDGVFKYGVTYSSAFGIFGFRMPYTCIIENDVTKNYMGEKLKKWKKEEILLLWQLYRFKDFKPL